MTEHPPPAQTERLPRNVRALTWTSLLTDISSEMLLNISPLFLANVLGAPPAAIGAIEGAAETTSSLLKAFSGWLSDRMGRRKPLAWAGYFISTLSKPFLALASAWPGFLLARLADRAGKGIRNPPRDALIADSVDSRSRGRAFGLHRMGDTLGAALGLVIALVVTLLSQGGALTLSRETYVLLALISVVPAALALVVLWRGVKEARQVRPAAVAGAPRLAGLRALGRPYFVFLAIVALFTLGNSSDAFLVLRAQERGLNVAQIFGMLISFNLLYALASLPLGSLSDRVGRRAVIIGGWLVYSLIYAGFAAAQTGAQVWLIYAGYGVYYAAVEGTARAYVADLLPCERLGLGYGVYNMIVGLMALPASAAAGLLWQAAGPNAPFALGAGLALLACVLLWLTNPSRTSARP